MLLELVIENFAVIDRLRVRFHEGLNLLTGETGSGKSIVVDALGLLFGDRASPEMVRTGAGRASISGIFSAPPGLEMEGFRFEQGELLIEREILAEGKSRAYLDNRPVTVALLKDLAPRLGDIHGQHEQQLLFVPDAQLDLVDTFGGIVRSGAAEILEAWRAAGADLAGLERDEQELLRLLDLWHFQTREIESAALKPGEDSALEAERRVLGNLGRLEENAGAAFGALYESPESAYSLVKIAQKRVHELARIDSALGPIGEQLSTAAIAVQESAFALRDYLSGLEASPERLEEVEDRLAAIEKLKRKYGSTIEEILAFLEKTRASIDRAEHSGERTAELRALRDRLAVEFRAEAARLTEARGKAGRELERQMVRELASLAMDRAQFQVEIEEAPWSLSGADAVRFLFTANAGEAPKPLEKVASGGELSRIALALKTCAAPKGRGRTFVFDEVDAGVSGRAAEGIGRRLKKLAARHQVLCVTHLAQVAGFADHHYLIEKRESRGRTVATVEELDRLGRVREIGRLLSGATVTDEALKQAERLIQVP
ncbi:MAG: DNA repair protein RecN [Bryobacteraceae bacterium]